jgi:hypothetical protein
MDISPGIQSTPHTVLDARRLVLQDCEGESVVLTGLHIGNLGLRLLWLAEFDNRGQPQVVARLAPSGLHANLEIEGGER